THGIDEAVFLGQRVLVLTARPGTLKEAMTIDLPQRETTADVRSTPEFARYRHRIWGLLHDAAPADAAVDERVAVGV
ncbi:MAG TPA: hypothetical protein VI318_02180, partial [Baekduia sp.]